MIRTIMKSKVHRATATRTDLEYEGSLTLDADLMDAADMVPHEKVHVYNITNGERFSTYLIKGKRGSGEVGINGAAAHKVAAGDKLILVTYALMSDDETNFCTPRIVMVDEKNAIREIC